MDDEQHEEEATAMAMDTVLKTLEARIEELVEAYRTARTREQELSARIAELEQRLASGEAQAGRADALESQRAELVARLEKVLATLDAALDTAPAEAAAD